MDRIVRGTAKNAQIRFFVCSTKELVEEARKRHNTSPVASAALGRLLTAGCMMGSMLKGEKDLLTLRIRGDGPIGGITVTADSKARVKGYVGNPDVILPANELHKLDVKGAVGAGYLDVIKDMGLKEPYVGQTALQTGEIAEDITFYFASSEQVPSSVGLGVLMNRDNTVRQAGGFIIQLMPFAEEETIEALEKTLGEITSVTSMLDSGMSPEDMIERLFAGLKPQITDCIEPVFYCSCSKERVEQALISIGKDEIKSMIEDGEEIEMKCQFCNSTYRFGIDELRTILKDR